MISNPGLPHHLPTGIMLSILSLFYKLNNNDGDDQSEHSDLMMGKLCISGPSHTISAPFYIILYWLTVS